MRRLIRFLIETIAGLLAAGALLGVTIPLLHAALEPLPRLLFHALVWTVAAACVLTATLRPGGSLRR